MPARRAPSTSATYVVARVQGALGGDAGPLQQQREYPGIGLEHASVAGRDGVLEEARQANRGQVCVAVADGEQPVPAVQPLQCGQHVVVQRHLVACAIEHREHFLGHRLRIAGLARVPP